MIGKLKNYFLEESKTCQLSATHFSRNSGLRREEVNITETNLKYLKQNLKNFDTVDSIVSMLIARVEKLPCECVEHLGLGNYNLQHLGAM